MSLMFTRWPPTCHDNSVITIPEQKESIKATISSCSRLLIKLHLQARLRAMQKPVFYNPVRETHKCPELFSRNSFASLTFVARYGLPPRSGWFNNISCRWFFRIFSLVSMRSLIPPTSALRPRISSHVKNRT